MSEREWGVGREREGGRERQTDRQTDRDTERERERWNWGGGGGGTDSGGVNARGFKNEQLKKGAADDPLSGRWKTQPDQR